MDPYCPLKKEKSSSSSQQGNDDPSSQQNVNPNQKQRLNRARWCIRSFSRDPLPSEEDLFQREAAPIMIFSCELL